MDLDEDDYELLGYGQQQAREALAKDLVYAQNAKAKYMREYMQYARQMNPKKYKEINRKYRHSEKGRTKANDTKNVKYKNDEKFRKKRLANNRKWYSRLKKDLVRYAAYRDKQNKAEKLRRDKQRGTKTTKTTDT